MRRRVMITGGMLLLAIGPPLASLFGEAFVLDLFTRIVIFGIAAMSLDLIVGYGGMFSFNQAMFLGIGGYAVGILSQYGITNGIIHFAVATAAAALMALVVGAISLRTSGVYFIMITLAFGQLVYYLSISLSGFGGDEGLNIDQHSNFGPVDLDNPLTLYGICYGALLVFLLFGSRLVGARFGMALLGARLNERRMAAIGFPVFRYKLAAYVISGAVCGFAGALLANQALFVSPEIMHWSRTGEIMMMVIMGGLGSLFGPVLGAIVYLGLEDQLADLTDHWQILLGPILVLIVMFGRRGLLGLLAGERGARDA